MSAPALLLPSTDLDAMRRRVRALAEDRPGVYRMTDPTGRILYVGKARRLRTRLLSYFRARFPDDKAARILHAAAGIDWDYAPSDFAARLGELRMIRKWRPSYNVQHNRTRRATFVTVSSGAAPKLSLSAGTVRQDVRRYGPLPSPGRVAEAVRVLNDLLQIRDCAERMPIAYAGQGDLFAPARRAACLRHEIGTCLGPCAGFVEELVYRRRVATAVAFLEGRTITPLDRVIAEMTTASDRGEYELASRWRDRFERLEWLLAALTRARTSIELLTFVYRDPGEYGDDRAYLIRRGVVRAVFPWPDTPIEREAFRAVVSDELATHEAPPGPLPPDTVDETLLLLGWFRQHPEALRRTEPLDRWAT